MGTHMCTHFLSYPDIFYYRLQAYFRIQKHFTAHGIDRKTGKLYEAEEEKDTTRPEGLLGRGVSKNDHPLLYAIF